MRPAWMTVHEGGRNGGGPVQPNDARIAALCSARDQALQMVRGAVELLQQLTQPELATMRDELLRKLDETQRALGRPAALLLADQHLLRASWVELQQALLRIQELQTTFADGRQA